MTHDAPINETPTATNSDGEARSVSARIVRREDATLPETAKALLDAHAPGWRSDDQAIADAARATISPATRALIREAVDRFLVEQAGGAWIDPVPAPKMSQIDHAFGDVDGSPEDKALFLARSERGEKIDAMLGPQGQVRAGAMMLAVDGVGEDLFWLNEHLEPGALPTWTSLRDYNRWRASLQDSDKNGETPESANGEISGDWVRLFVDGAFSYGDLTMAAHHVVARMEQEGDKAIDRLVPSRFIRGPEDGMRTKGGFIFDIVNDAHGHEDILAALKRFNWRRGAKVLPDLTAIFATRAPCAWIEAGSDEIGDPWIKAIFSDLRALDHVRPRCFMRDVRALAQDAGSLDEILDAAVAEHVAAIEALHDSLRRGDWSALDQEDVDDAKAALEQRNAAVAALTAAGVDPDSDAARSSLFRRCCEQIDEAFAETRNADQNAEQSAEQNAEQN